MCKEKELCERRKTSPINYFLNVKGCLKNDITLLYPHLFLFAPDINLSKKEVKKKVLIRKNRMKMYGKIGLQKV